MTVTNRRGLGYLGTVKQSAQGSPGAPTRFYILEKNAFRPTQEINEFRNGNSRDISGASKSRFLYTGAFQTKLYANEGAALFAYAMGADSVSGSGDPYTHAITLADDLPYLCAEAAYYEAHQIDRVQDCKIGKLTLEAKVREEATLTAMLLGGQVAVQSSGASVSFSNTDGEGPMRMADAAFTLTTPTDYSAMASLIQSVKVDIDQDLNDESGPGQIHPVALFEQGRRITVELEAIFTSDALNRLVHYGGSSGTAVSSTIGTGSLVVAFNTGASPERSITVTVPQFRWLMSEPIFDPNGKTGRIKATAGAYRSSGGTLPISVSAKNGISAAYI